MLTTLFESNGFRVGDYSCRPKSCRAGGLETAASYDIVFVRCGSFVKHIGSDSFIADPNHVLFFRPDEPYQVSHPNGAVTTVPCSA